MNEIEQKNQAADAVKNEAASDAGKALSQSALDDMANAQACDQAGGSGKGAALSALPNLELVEKRAAATKQFDPIEVPASDKLDSPDWHKHLPYNKGVPGQFEPVVSHRLAPDPRVAAAIAKIDEATMKTELDEISGATEATINGKKVKIEGRSTYGGYEQGLAYFKEKFEKAGYTVTMDPYTRRGQTYYNMRAIKPGNTKPDEAVMFGAHIDSTAGWPWGGKEAKAPGADDDGSGSVAVLEIAKAIKDLPLDRTVVFSLFSGEEQGLWGSRAMAEQYAQKANTKIVGMYQLDMIGYAPDGQKTVESHDTKDNAAAHALTDNLAAKAQQYKLDLKVWGAHNEELTERSDHYPFHAKGIPAVLLTEPYDTAKKENPNYHSTTDTSDQVNIPFMANVTKAAAAAGVELAGLQSQGSKNSVKDNVIQMMPLRCRISSFK